MSRFYLSGGFGNILFQYVGINYIQDFSQSLVHVDKTLISNNFISKYIIRWNIHDDYSDLLFKKCNIKSRNNYFGILFIYISKFLKYPFFSSVYQSTHFNKLYLNMNFYQGYYQNISLYDKKWFNLKIKELSNVLKINSKIDRRVLHFRGGDTVDGATHFYYYETVLREISDDQKLIYIVSDDKITCKKFLRKFYITNYKFISGNVLEDFIFLANSDTIYCAPSTFSWWASILGSENKKITMPLFYKNRFPIDKEIRYI